jgi:hypothetical protein
LLQELRDVDDQFPWHVKDGWIGEHAGPSIRIFLW